MYLSYRLIQCLSVPALTARAIWLRLRGRLDTADLRESLIGPRPLGAAIWIHGASLGEIASARPVITALARDHDILVTVTRKPAKTAVSGWGIPRVTAAMAPLDMTRITRSILSRNRVGLMIVLENELWPARLLAAHAAGVPVVLLAARISAKSARLWGRFPRLVAAMLGPVARLFPQDQGSAERLIALGAAPGSMAPPIKLKAAFDAPDIAIPAQFAGVERAQTILAAATHPGEEAMVLSAFAQARRTNPHLRLIIAPRHDTRSDDVARLIAQAGHPDERRSRGDDFDGPVYLADTLGEMALWYRLAGVAFIGGSLVPKGGHTPYEPCAMGCPILHGPHVDNFAEDYARFAAAGAAVRVADAYALGRAMLDHLADDAMAQRARLVPQMTDIDALVAEIRALLD